MNEFIPQVMEQYRYLPSWVRYRSRCQRLHTRVEVSTYYSREIIGKCGATVACCRLQVKKGEFFVNRVYDLGAEGLN